MQVTEVRINCLQISKIYDRFKFLAKVRKFYSNLFFSCSARASDVEVDSSGQNSFAAISFKKVFSDTAN